MYRRGDLLALVIDPRQTCMVVEDQYGSHVKVCRANQPAAEWLREEDVQIYGARLSKVERER